MSFANGRIKKKYGIVDERKELKEVLVEWVTALNGNKFLHGEKVTLPDLMVFGVLRSIRNFQTFREVMADSPALKRCANDVPDRDPVHWRLYAKICWDLMGMNQAASDENDWVQLHEVNLEEVSALGDSFIPADPSLLSPMWPRWQWIAYRLPSVAEEWGVKEIPISAIKLHILRLRGSPRVQEAQLGHWHLFGRSKVISDAEFQRIKNTNSSQKIDELSKLWDGPNKDDKRNVKLKVEFIYPDHTPTVSRGPTVSNNIPASVSENVDSVRNRLTRNAAEADSVTASGNPDLIMVELQNLRKKYDAVVEYTVHLTAERDSIVGQLEAAQKELTNRDKQRKKIDGSVATKKDNAETLAQGFSLFAVLATALICFLLGKYIA
eukprot:gene206-139_t